ncbi:MAG TPA: nucleotidyltransferase family protein [Phenylobacterium sp.]|uniref:nucleotidyltransferase family protein n=1 Tax=Phenylobacterium sp. TaxID=1871053 RepID=UPI002B475446|nr:nucleotidyltransferase family protein [Phenylobacterium sp.]HKR86676.1 nucleotidyltransferase family protein [Phenylobacterium sp.]
MRPERALVLAGARPQTDPVAAYAGVSHKALITLAGEPLLARVVGALQEAGLRRIAVSASDPQVTALAAQLGCEVLPAEAGPSLSALRGIEALGTPVLLTTCDHALLQAEWIAQLLDAAPDAADVSVLLARREVVEAAAPGTRRTYLKFADGAWSGCNLFLVRSERGLGAIRLWRQIEADRKRPWRIIRRLGPLTLIRYLTGRLALAEALRRLGALCGAEVAAVPSRFGLAAVDVDKPADLELVRAMVGGEGRIP